MDEPLITDLSTLKLENQDIKTWKLFFPDTKDEQTFFDGVVEVFNNKSPEVIQSIDPKKPGERVSDEVKTQFEDVIELFANLFSITRHVTTTLKYRGKFTIIDYELKNYTREFYMILDELIKKNYSFQLTKQIKGMTPKQTTLHIQLFKTNILLEFYDDFVQKRNQQNASNIARQQDDAFKSLSDSTLYGGNIRRSRPRRNSSSTHRRRPSRKSASTKRRRSRRPHRRTSRK